MSHFKNNQSFRYDAVISPSDVKRLFMAMEKEVTFYNHLINIFSAQLNRDHNILISITPDMVELFGEMCINPCDIYNIKSAKIAKNVEPFQSVINTMSTKQRFLLTEGAKSVFLDKDVRKRMGISLLEFFIKQAEHKARNEIVDIMTGEISYRAAFESLSPTNTFHKKHIQISKKSCKIEKDDNTGFMKITTPYNVHPIVVKDQNIFHKNWNFMIISQDDKIQTHTGSWVIDFKNTRSDEYYIKKIDRHGKSSIVETTKNRI